MDGRFISYLRVSTDRQGKSGLGLEAQRQAVTAFLNGGSWTLAAEYVEVESGKVNTRPKLTAALTECRLTGATLIVAKLDRLARNLRFLQEVIAGAGKGGVQFCDLPALPPGPVGKFMLQQMGAVAELEAGLISQRTKAALAAAKARDVKLGGWRGGPKVDGATGLAERQRRAADYTETVRPIVAEMRNKGLSLRQIAAALTERGVATRRGGAWTAAAVNAVLT